jgi:hypothetical protein
MNDRPDHDSRLIADSVHGNWNEGPPAEFARTAAAHARRHRRTRRTVLASTAAAATLAVAFVLFPTRPRPVPALPVTTPQANIARGYEVISDAQLLAELRDRSVVMVRHRNGRSDFVLVGDKPDAPVSALP